MTPSELIAAFETLAEAPEGVARLRVLILRLAVRGRLVPQDSGDEPSDALLPRLHAAKQRLVQGGSIRATKSLPPISQSEVPFGVPVGWQWVRLVDLAWPQAGFAFKAAQFNDAGRGRPLIRIRDIDCDHTEAWFDGEYRSEFLVQTGDYLIGMDGNFNVRRWKGPEALLNQRVSRLVFYGHAEPAFVAMALQERLDELLGVKAYTTVQHLSGGQISEALVPLPPIAEQCRIVARVDELMGLLDRLEAARTKREATRAAARDSVHAALREADSPEAVDAAWTRFAQRMEDLLCDPADIAPLRQTVLQLAVRGRLVRQDPSDEPPFAFLERIAAEKARRINTARAGASADPHPVGEQEELFGVPPSWCWVRFGETHINRDAERIPLSRDARSLRSGPFDYYGASGVIDKVDAYLFDRTQLLIGEDGANLILRSTPIAFLAHGKYWVNNHAHVLDSLDLDSLAYLAVFVNSIDLKPYVTGTAQPKLNQARMNGIPCPFPPLAEQRRIVARVSQLTDLLHQLEQRLAKTRANNHAFAAAVAHHVIA